MPLLPRLVLLQSFRTVSSKQSLQQVLPRCHQEPRFNLEKHPFWPISSRVSVVNHVLAWYRPWMTVRESLDGWMWVLGSYDQEKKVS